MKKFNFMWIVYLLMLVVTIASASADVSQSDLLDGLVSYWKFDETSGSTAVDSHGSNDGTIGGATIDQTGKINKAYSFDGTNDYVNIGTIDHSGNVETVSFWFKTSNSDLATPLTDANNRRILYFNNDESGRIQFLYQKSTGGGGSADGTRVGGYYDMGSSLYDDDWHHLVYTVDGENGDINMWIDGDPVTVTMLSEGYHDSISGGTRYIGGDVNNNRRYFDGLIDEFAIWDRALSSDEVSALYNDGDGLSYDNFDSNPTIGAPSITTGTTYDDSYYKGEITIRSSINNFDNAQCQYSINDGSSWLSADAISGFCEKTGLTPNTNIDVKFRARSGSTGAWVTSSTKSYTYDNTAPSSLSFSPNSRDWDNTDVLVMTSAVDSGSGLDKSSMLFCFTSSSSCVPNDAIAGIDPPVFESGNDIYEFTIGNNGETRMCFNIADNLGTRSETSCSGIYKVDKTSPTTSGEITSGSAITEGENTGVYFTDVVYTITPADALSGVASTEYCVDSTNTCTPNTAYTTSITINTNGDHYIRFRSTDVAGNVQTTQSSGLIERDDTLVTFFSATLVDAYTGAGINNFCMDIRNPSTGTLLDSYCTTTGTITTEYEYAVENYNLSFYNIGGAGTETHFDFSTIHTINEDFAGEVAQAYLDISLFEAVTSNVISGDFNFTIDGGSIISSSSLPLPITSGEFDLVISKTGYEDSTYTVNIDALTTYTLDAFLGDVLLRLDAKELGTNATINTFNGWVYNAEFDYNITFSTTTGVIFVPLKQNLTYDVQGIIPNYATLDSETISINDTQFNYTFIGFRINAIDLVFLNEANKNKITDREIRLEMIGDYASYNFTTSNGELELSLLEPSGYIMRFFVDGFDDGFYFFTVLNQSYSTLNLYMINSSVSDQVTVTIIDEGAKPVEGAVVKSLKYDLATNSYLLMEIRISDFAGETIFNVKKNQEFYKFIVEVDGVAVRTTNPSYITSDNLNIQIVRLGLIGTEFFELLGITSTITYNNVTNNFRAEYNDANNLGTEYCLRVIRVGRSNEVIGTVCSSSSAGTLLLNHEVVQGRIYEAELYLKINPGQTINKFILDLSETFDAGSMGIFLQILLTIFAALVFIYNPSVGAILTPFSLILGRLLGLTTLSWYMITPLLIVGIIIAYLIERR